ncbi:methylated-DNA--[protein]-cysteine S-methyltransferase [Nocardia jinanensis]|uniref:methylated-DNA--[protein]-cysteine S-methyltransferase n=1 Tax=Nocardia jinanensis TaxID=382504 RepID=A0A917VSG9_9NOCA|nr:methylated-DNA--[protein]-cysteine S-methyltransferase [Nocardia jinanensis]GGL14179.1 methylated-DNA--protein-cysteine methyltransferase [Nocardia jinanensis]
MTDIRYAQGATELGMATFVTDGDALTGCYLSGRGPRPEPARSGEKVELAQIPVLRTAHAELGEYLAGERRDFDVPLATSGDEFEERVWAMLREIAFGDTVTYGHLAEQLGDRGLAQRVGRAVGGNPLLVFIPCHRVVGAGGKLVGYAAGLHRKRRLLELEEPVAVRAARLF